MWRASREDFHKIKDKKMKAVLQRVKYASVVVDGETVGQCGEGLMILLGVAQGDTEEDARLLATKICNLRIFTDEISVKKPSLLKFPQTPARQPFFIAIYPFLSSFSCA